MKEQRDIFYSTTKELSETEYQKFVNYVQDNYEDWYAYKICYEVSETNNNYFVTLYGNEIVTFSDIFDWHGSPQNKTFQPC